jgi:hypothetical protein
VLPGAISNKRLKRIPRRCHKIHQQLRVVQHAQLPSSNALNLARKNSREAPLPDLFSLAVAKALDHVCSGHYNG